VNTSKSSSTGWRTVALEEVVTRLTNGYVGPTRDIYVPQGIPYLLARHIKDNRLTFDGKTFVSPEFNRKHSKSTLKEGDVLMVQSGHIGETAVVPKAHEGHNCHALIVISPKKDKLLGSYLSYYFNSLIGRRELEKFETGITLKHLNCKDVRTVKIPLPPLEEQKRIAAIAQKADRLRRTRRYALQLSNTYLQSVFLEMFGNPATNPKGWEIVKLSYLGELDRGRSKHRPRNAPKLFGGSYPFIQTGDVANSAGYIRTYKQTYSELGLKQSKLWVQGTLCITIAANIAKTGILTFDACFPDSIVGFSPNDKTNTEFIQQWFNFIQQNLEETAPESAQKNINLEILRNLDLPLPPKLLQEKFARIVQKFERLRTQQREGDRQAEHLFQTLVHRAFRGELTPQDSNDESASVLLEEIGAEQAKAEAEAKAATQAMGDAAEYLGTKAKQQNTEPIQLTLPGIE